MKLRNVSNIVVQIAVSYFNLYLLMSNIRGTPPHQQLTTIQRTEQEFWWVEKRIFIRILAPMIN